MNWYHFALGFVAGFWFWFLFSLFADWPINMIMSLENKMSAFVARKKNGWRDHRYRKRLGL